MKMNKKGFTLIEMLVVIAIIAVLVAIVVPAVSNSTTKAQASTDAANLRSLTAEAQIACLNAGYSNGGNAVANLLAEDIDSKTTGDQCCLSEASQSAKCKSDSTKTLAVSMTADGSIICKFGDYTIEDFSAVADGTYASVAEAHTANAAG